MFGHYIAGVLFTNRHTFRILLFTFHPQIGVCLDGLLFWGSVWSTCLPPSGQDRLKGPTCRPRTHPLRRPLSSKPAFFKRFRVGQKLAVSTEGSHCSGICGQSRPPISCCGNMSLRHLHIPIELVLFGAFHRLLEPLWQRWVSCHFVVQAP